jgi:gamma-glutamyltranspeptidase / glutathione hydrolase
MSDPMKKTFSIFFALIVYTCIGNTAPKSPVHVSHGMVVAAEPLAARVGQKILEQGGNAIDAAVATGFALAVTYPGAGNIGGGGFMVIRFADGRTAAIDYREQAPAAAARRMYLDSAGNFLPEKSTYGHLAVGVPGSVAGMLEALKKFGTMNRAAVMAPAIALAGNGFPLHSRLASSLKSMIPSFSKFPGSVRSFTHNGAAMREGEMWKQPDLAGTLRLIARNGEDGFYRGRVADQLVAEMKRGGGLITHSDLEHYRPVFRDVVRGTYRGYDILSMSPPSSGGIALIQLLNILEPFDLHAYGWNSAKTVHVMTEAMRRVYADRAEFLGDPEFYSVPLRELVSKQYADVRRSSIDTLRASPSASISHGNPVGHESNETTHYSVADKYGNCVSVTTTLNGGYGSCVTVEGAGFLLNNEMDDFSAKPGTPNMFGLIGNEANAIAPGKRMLSSMTPTIIVKNNEPFMVIGSPGGSTIITTVLQVILNVVDFGMNIQQAVDAPRIHHQWLPDILYYEKGALSEETIAKLRGMGHTLEQRAGTQGLAEGLLFDAKKKTIDGASDSRGYGEAAGW